MFKQKMQNKTRRLNRSIRKSRQHSPNKYNFYGKYDPVAESEIANILERYNESIENY